MTSIDDAKDVLRSTSAKANFHRLTRLLMCGGVRLLRETFDSIHSPADLPVKLADPTIKAQLSGARLTPPEKNCLYPSPGVFGKSSDFDITLIFKLFRTICNLTAPPGPRGWDDLPNSTDHSLVADLVRIKYYRNKIYGHRHTMEVSDIEFVHLWGKISEALLRIATNISPVKRDEWEKSIDDLCHNPLTPDEERCIEELETWYKQDMDVKNELEKLSGTMEEKLNTLHEELTRLRSQPPVIVVIGVHLESITQTLPPQAGYHQAAESEPMFLVPNLPEPEQVVGAEAGSPNVPGPNNPPEIDVWRVILSFKETVGLFLRYLWYKLQVLVRNDEVGSWHVTVECSSLQILEGLWDDYRSGHLNSVAQEILITPQVLEKLGLTVVKLRTFISEDQYEKGKMLFEASSGVEEKGETQSTSRAIISRATSEGSIVSDLLARISLLEQENVELKGKVERIEGIFHSERDWKSKIEKENNELKRLVEANQRSTRLKDSYEPRLRMLEMRTDELEDDLRWAWFGREKPYSRESHRLQGIPRTLVGDTGWMYGATNGFCQVIINRTSHEAIVGEEDEIVSAFQSLGYDVDKATCTPNDDVKQLVQRIAERDYNNNDIFVCFVLSNVTENLEVVRLKGGAFNVNDLLLKFDDFENPSLSGKPKIFVILFHQKAAAPGSMYSVAKNVPHPGLCLFVPYRKGYLSTLLTEITLHGSDLDLLSILKEVKKSFYEKTNVTIPDPVQNLSGRKVFLCRKDAK